ncbi:E3 ubiquitin-protein ligase PPP1R11 [Drosophila pseudoobscura]|uniref:E3 ubiquitin-protein ligase PPP1R11 n=1 Tax=Drosophila pseudoobscura pseudoobscura TaxID=46245 RepID=A0A6I8UGC7_DROPS|nr:E3 ubiquitin-protein ligase PPP1R11 [Drosophila pseudoobscura]
MNPQENTEKEPGPGPEPSSIKLKLMAGNGGPDVAATGHGGGIQTPVEGSTRPFSIAGGGSSISSTINQSVQSMTMTMPMPTLRFVLRRPASPTISPSSSCSPLPRHVRFHESVVDNEKMNRRKSKCCCIYRKPHPFGESSSDTDDECEHCFGHPEVRARNRQKKKMAGCGCGCCGGHSPPAAVVPEECPEAPEQEAVPGDSAAPKTDDDQSGEETLS